MRAPLPGLLRVLVLFHEAEVLGAANAVLRPQPLLAERGWTASGWLPSRGPLEREAAAVLAAVRAGDRPFAFSRSGWRASPGVLARLRRMPRYLRELHRVLVELRPHVVHANTLLALPEAALARSLGLPVVLHSHESYPPTAKRAAAVGAAARVADVLVAVSESVAEMLRPAAGRTPVTTVHNGVPSPGAAARSPAGAAPAGFVVGTVGTVARGKGTDVFLRAAALAREQRPQMRFEHVGDAGLHGDSALAAELDALRADPRLAGALVEHGPRPAADVLGRWSAFVLPSRHEAFPLATLEAMAAGVPVVASRVGGIPEQIDHLEHGILVPPEDAEGIAAWLVRLHDDEGLRRRLCAAAGERVRARFTLERQADGLHRAYLAALNLRHGPPAVRARTRRAL